MCSVEGCLVSWYMWVLLVCLVIGPFDALYVYIKAERRRERLRKAESEGQQEAQTQTRGPASKE